MSIPCPFTIYIDTAEQHPFDFIGLRADSDKGYETYSVRTELRCLGRHPNSFGDYSLVGGIGRCHVERKSMADLQSTLLGFQDGHRDRFECELSNLKGIEAPLIVIECSEDDCLRASPSYGKKSAQQNAKILYRSMMAYMQDYRIPIKWSSSRKRAQFDTFHWMRRFWEKNLKARRKKSSIVVPELPSFDNSIKVLESI